MIAKRISTPKSLVVFSDDWGRHPSSCQHLVRQLLPDYQVLWVNTIGTRAPRLDLATIKRVGEKLKQWTNKPEADEPSEDIVTHPNLQVINPRMWPWFSKSRDRRLNSWLLSRQLAPLIEALPQPVTAITTLPITADLPGLLPVEKWVYYCVDDFGEWPGLDGNTLRTMDEEMIARADDIVSVSNHLQQMIASNNRESSLLTHGVDLEHWTKQDSALNSQIESTVRNLNGPLAVFWGVVDRRLDTKMLTALSQKMSDGNILLVGPQQDADPNILNLPNVHAPGPVPFADLPALAGRADVLVMPYADLPVTRAMQPLKMKEYIATGRPVVVSSLPAVKEWSDCMDVCDNSEQFADAVINRLNGNIPVDQQNARLRLKNEDWASKAKQLEQHLATACPTNSVTEIQPVGSAV